MYLDQLVFDPEIQSSRKSKYVLNTNLLVDKFRVGTLVSSKSEQRYFFVFLGFLSP